MTKEDKSYEEQKLNIANKRSNYLKSFTYDQSKESSENTIIHLDLESLRLIASLCISSNPLVNRLALYNIKSFFDNATIGFNSESSKQNYVKVINKLIEARLEYQITNKETLISFVKGGLSVNDNENDLEDSLKSLTILNDGEIKFTCKMIESYLVYLNMTSYVPKFVSLLSDIETNKSNTKIQGLINDFNELVFDYASYVRTVENNLNKDPDFDTNGEKLELFLDDFLSKRDKIGRNIITGVRELNELVGGGFNRERVYLITALAGMGKSMLALNIMKQIVDFNPDIKTLNPDKTPCLLMLTQENTVYETFERILEMNNIEDINLLTKDDLKRILFELGIIDAYEPNEKDKKCKFRIVIKYEPEGSINTDYLYNVYDDLYQEGYETVLLVQDHIMRIRSSRKTSDLRVEMGYIINEFKAFATLKKCAVITLSHLNRTAESKIKEALDRGNQDPLKTVGRDAIGESLLLINNADISIFMHRQVDEEGNSFMCFNRMKERVKVNPLKRYFVHPMDGVILIPDVHLKKSLSRFSIYENDPANNIQITVDKNTRVENVIGKYNENLGRNITQEDITGSKNARVLTMEDMFNTYIDNNKEPIMGHVIEKVQKERLEEKDKFLILDFVPKSKMPTIYRDLIS